MNNEPTDGTESCQKCGDPYELRGEPSKYCDPCAQEALIEVEAERESLKARLEAMRPVPPVSDWLAVELHNARFWCTRTRVEPSAENIAKRDWLETILGEPIESDPWKDRR